MKFKRIDNIRTLKTALLILFAVILYYAFSEAVLTFFSDRQIGNDFEYFAAKTFSPKEWEVAEKFRDDLVSIGQRGVLKKGSIVYNYLPASSRTVNFNSTGFRGPEIKEKEEGEIRVAIFGCSRIWGNFQADNSTIPAIVQKELNEKFVHRKISVINMGVEGYDLQRAVETAKLYHKEIQFDVAVFYFGYTDMTFAYLNGIKNWEPFDKDVPMDKEVFDQLVGLSGEKNIFERSSIYKMVMQSVRGEFLNSAAEQGRESDSYFKDIPDVQIKTAERFPAFFVDLMLRASEYLSSRNIETFFVLTPTASTKEPLSELEMKVVANYERLFPGYNKYIVKCVEGVLKHSENFRNSLNLIDHTDIFDGDPVTIFYDGMHMIPSGSKKSAHEISSFLMDFLIKKYPDLEKRALK